MIRFFLSLIVCVSLLLGATDSERLESAQKALNSSDEIEQFRGYNEFKTLYTKSLSTKNSAMTKETLEGIIKGGEILKIDVTRYKTELSKLAPQEIVKPVEIAPPVIAQENQKPLVFPKEYLKAPSVATNVSTNFLTPSSEQLKQQIEIPKFTNDLGKSHRLLDVKWKDNRIELLFDTAIDSKEVQLSKIIEADKQRFRYIIDIEQTTISGTKVLEQDKLQKIRLAQYDAKTLRIVIENNEAIALKPVYKGTSIYVDFSFQKGTLTTPSPAVTPAVIQPPIVKDPPPIIALPPMQSITPRDRSKKVIVIDPGHGGKDSGAIGNGYMEKEIVLKIGLELADQLRTLGYTVYMTRSTDIFIELKDRTHFANDKSADLFLSIHANAIPKGADANTAYGIETYFLSPGRSERAMRVAALENSEDMGEMGAYGKLSFLSVLNTEKIIASNKLAIDIQKGVLNNLRKQYPNVKDNSVREAPFWVLVGAQMPAILLETGYISNPDESARIADPKYQKWMVEGMVDGIKHYFANNP
ncbi:MAG: N-acetylmuramoyl-L-alanine amidase [Sulfuricurvum sp.]|uniref:N-acetylmuramoyl-L-alanine amidase n=1 Tax=Sulfuricurvum sp. TaxID=2025608 RepID=UPI0026056556|nr:N-acetylmuramoyl-L-alanine amidase [Sulfuricurvum sp.]MDD2828898.1 N-acetylmuramoyl-L-alanine amidase [Sulfuricurvum sp.]MDD4948561.1 N-acetylmuramoyl-L-alanine amidase [Sulfuricurvum sp.]